MDLIYVIDSIQFTTETDIPFKPLLYFRIVMSFATHCQKRK